MPLAWDGLARARLWRIAGALLMLAGIGWVAMTERGLIHYREVAGRHGGAMLDLGAEALPGPGQQGYMARLVGVPQVTEAAHDAEFNLSRNTPVLIRHVEMFQWREVHFGGRVDYELDWTGEPIDSSRFEYPAGHGNPGSFPIAGQRFDAGRVRLGGFALDPVLLQALPGSARVAPDMASLPANLAASFSLRGDYLETSAKPGQPRHGDLRVSWEEIPLREVTVVARIDGDRLVPATNAADGKGYDVEVGDRSLLDVFPDLPIPPALVFLQRGLAILLAALGAYLVFSGHRGIRHGVVQSLAMGLLAVSGAASVVWLGSDLHISSYWLLLALLGVLLMVRRQRRKN